MSKLNPLVKATSKFDEERTAGGHGIKSAKQDNYSLLRRVVLANLLWEQNAYSDGIEISKEISRLIPLCNPVDVANLALEARLIQKLRHTPLFICVEMLKHANYKGYVADILPKIITRADMITDFLAIYKKQNGHIKPLANSAKQGLALAFHNFNEYQFAKYDRNADIKLRDAMFLVHPNPKLTNEDKTDLFNKIANRTLNTPDTWEVALSTGKDKKQTWTNLIENNKIGGLAMLRNIRNMMQANVDKKVISKGLENLKSHMLLPLNYLQSARINPEYSRDIEDAMLKSYSNLPKLPGKTLFIVDVSGSMQQLTSGNSQMSRLDYACAMAMLAVNQCENYDLVATAGADHNWTCTSEVIKYPKPGFDIAQQIAETRKRVGQGGIFTRQCLEWCYNNVGKNYERIIVFTDSQDMDRKNKVPNPYGKFNYIVDISSNKKGINYKNVWTAEISGFSEAFLKFIAAFEGIENKFEEE